MSTEQDSGSEPSETEVPRTDICEECEREIVPELTETPRTGRDELIQQAREAEEGFMPVTAGTVTVRWECRCSSVDVEYGPGSTSAWDIPDGWLWEGSE